MFVCEYMCENSPLLNIDNIILNLEHKKRKDVSWSSGGRSVLTGKMIAKFVWVIVCMWEQAHENSSISLHSSTGFNFKHHLVCRSILSLILILSDSFCYIRLYLSERIWLLSTCIMVYWCSTKPFFLCVSYSSCYMMSMNMLSLCWPQDDQASRCSNDDRLFNSSYIVCVGSGDHFSSHSSPHILTTALLFCYLHSNYAICYWTVLPFCHILICVLSS